MNYTSSNAKMGLCVVVITLACFMLCPVKNTYGGVAAIEADYLDSTWLQVGDRRQFFFDDLMLEQVQNVTRRYYSPEKVTTDKPLIESDQPWEHVTYFTCNSWNVIYDPKDKIFKCWYEDWIIEDPQNAKSWVRETDGKFCVNFGVWPSRVCYAESKDGINWVKPALGIVKENGHNTNIVIGGKMGTAHSTYVTLDEREKDPDKRFKAVFVYFDTKRKLDGKGVYKVASSPDGIHWTIWEKETCFGSCGPVLGDSVIVSQDPETGIFWANNRHSGMCGSTVQDRRKPTQPSWIAAQSMHKIAHDNRRRIFRSESMDLLNWSSPQPMVVHDHRWDNIDDTFYAMDQFQVGSDWVGLLNIFHMTDNQIDVQLVYSRDGKRFQRVRPGQAWLTWSGEDSKKWDSTQVMCTSKPLVVGDELYVYYCGSTVHHDWWMVGGLEGLDVPEATDMNLVSYSLGLAKMKKDRFVSISSAEAREGLIVTPPVFPKGGRKLILNVKTRPGGAVRVALADGQGTVLKGFEKESCVPFTGDSVEHRVVWKGQKKLPSISPIGLYFYLDKADLFSFQFVD